MNNNRLAVATRAALLWLALCLPPPVCAAAAGQQAPAESRQPALVDLSGVERFLEITAILEQDRQPTPEQWDRLFATPGYAVLLAREFSRETFVQRFSLAFMPSKAAELESQMKREAGYQAQFLPHYLKAKVMRREIEQRVAELRTQAFTDEAVAMARTWLPDAHVGGTPLVAVVVFKDDARGYDPVVFDILYKRDRAEFLETVAHEFHHWYRNRLAPDLLRDHDTLWVIEQTHLEGMADLINVPSWMKRPPDTLDASQKRYLDAYARSAEIVRRMDDLFANMHDAPARRRDLGAALMATVPQSGHPTGFFMAETIAAELGKAALVATVSNPFAFYRAYDTAARKGDRTGAPAFSDKAMALLRELEGQYAPETRQAGTKR